MRRFLLLSCMALTVLATGCGNDEQNQKAQPAPAEKAVKETKEAKEAPKQVKTEAKADQEKAAAKKAPVVIDFEGPKNYSASAGTVSEEAGVVISGKKSLRVSSYGQNQDWFEFFTSNAGDLMPGFVYTAKLNYRIIKADPKAKLYMLFRSKGKGWGKFDRGWKNADNLEKLVGKSGSITTEIGLDNRYDYELMIGIKGKAEVVIDDIVVTPGKAFHEESEGEKFVNSIPKSAKQVALFDFEKPEMAGKMNAMASVVGDKPISGKGSLLGDSTKSKEQWNIFFASEKGLIKTNNTYYISFNYKILEVEKGAQLYILVRSPKGNEYDVLLKSWSLPAGAEGTLNIKTTVYRPWSDYSLSFGLAGKGKVLIDDVSVLENPRPVNTALKERKPFDKSKAELVWEDNFDGDKLNTGEWNVSGDSRRRGGMWRKRNCFVDGKGNFVMRFDKSDGTYNGGCITSKKKFKFGYFEARIKFNKFPGHWLGFWLMDGAVNKVGNEGRDGTEIDIVESPWRGANKASHALHWDGYGDDHKSTGWHPEVPNLDEGYHTFAVDWFEHGYVFYVDGKETWRTDAGDVCQVPLSILISDELGGWSGKPVDDKLPDDSFIDYVRVYKTK
ncbi:MAG: family 16 glycosylhydrolase [Planctomycetes bacterium]|nr:family 16 glycosylhydrolase [Planctomycetota bacterium]